MRPPAILTRAACKGADVNLFFPSHDQRGSYNAAKRICSGCPVRLECLLWALAADETDGMLGGATPGDRKLMAAGLIDVDIFEPGHGDKPGTTAGYSREKAADMPHCVPCVEAYNANSYERQRARMAKAS